MQHEPTEESTGGDGSERYVAWMDGAVRWLYDRADISDCSRSDIHALARNELDRRKKNEPLEATPRAVWTFLFVEHALRPPREERDD